MMNLTQLKQAIEKKYGFSHPAGRGWDDALADALKRKGEADPNGSVYAYEKIKRDFGPAAMKQAFLIAGGRWSDGSFPSERELKLFE